MKLALVGMGRMGREVDRVAAATGHDVVLRLDLEDNRGGVGLTADALAGVDAVVEFSVADAVLPNVRRVAAAGVPMVVGTTGWDDDLDEVVRVVEEHDGALVHAPNFSLGANLFAALVRRAAELFEPYEEYDPYVVEHHHRGKADAPSGTALRLAEVILAATGHKTRVQAGNPEGPIAAGALHVSSVRAGAAFGRHTVGLDSPADSIELTHDARGREGFARGALLAAEKIRGRRGVYGFAELLGLEPTSDPGSE